MTEQTTTCARCGDPIAAPYPTRIAGEPYHAACARAEEAERLDLFACEECLDPFPANECVLIDVKPGEPLIVCVDCWTRAYPAEDATLMSVVIAEQQQGGDE